MVRRVAHLANRSIALLAALGFLAISLAFHNAGHTLSAFYNTPSIVPSAPGQLLRVEPYSTAVPAGARAWLILCTTESSLGAPAIGSAIVVAPERPSAGPRPVILWTHGTVGIARSCAPSNSADPFNGVPALPQGLAHGWVMVAPDYVGMGTQGVAPYLIGTGEAYSSLDAVRAAHHLSALSLTDQTVVWGHSQGGHAALW
jgi:hypothetical protein